MPFESLKPLIDQEAEPNQLFTCPCIIIALCLCTLCTVFVLLCVKYS